MKIVWSPQARDDLLQIYRYIAKDNPRAARVLHERLASGIAALADAPHIGRPGRVVGTREWAIPGTTYVVPYRVEAATLQILRIYHGARLWPENF